MDGVIFIYCDTKKESLDGVRLYAQQHNGYGFMLMKFYCQLRVFINPPKIHRGILLYKRS